MSSLPTRTVLITAGNRGLGKALVDRFVLEGWNVLATARQLDSLPATLPAECRFALDLSQHESVVLLAQALLDRKQSIDCIIHNAGFNPKDSQKDRPGYFESTFYCEQFSAANVAESLMINTLHPMELTGRLHPVLAKDGGIVLAISSWLGSIASKTVRGHYGYTGSKALMNLCIKGLSLEFEKDKAEGKTLATGRVAVALNPGWMQTDMGGGDRADISPDEVAKRIFGMIEDGFLQQQNGRFINTDRTEHPW
jgi:NAD(P)-dependent dehydrogenase (short-subunit alcohol dehydrogenase family)